MKRWLLATAILVSGLSSGCGTFWEIAATNLTETPLNAASDCARRKHLTDDANKAYHEFVVEHPEDSLSCDFAKGFVDGFVDYVEAGGNGEPPPNPPWRYSLARYDSPEGRQALLDYQAGFRQGSAVALDSGLRDLVLIHPGQAPAPSSDPNQRRITNPNNTKNTDPMLPAPNLEPARDGQAPARDEPTTPPETNP